MHSPDIIGAITNYMGDGAKEIENLKKLKEVFPVDDIMIVGFFENKEDPRMQAYKDVGRFICHKQHAKQSF